MSAEVVSREMHPHDPTVVLEVEAAQEVVDLIDDTPGVADEDLLDEALAAFGDAAARLEPRHQRGAAAGQLVAIEMDSDAVDAVTGLIVDDDAPTTPRLLRRVRDRLRGKLRLAARRRRG